MRIDKLLATVGIGSRKEVKKFLKTGMVKVNGVSVKDSKTQVDPTSDKITMNGVQIEYKEFIYVMMNKPQGVLSATEDATQKTVLDLLEFNFAVYEPFPVGRLDKDTEGFLLLTNDGKLAHQLLSPKKHVPKTYFAVIHGEVCDEDIVAFKEGVVLDDGYQTKPAILSIMKSGQYSDIEVTITEGKYHQVKRMFEAVGKSVVYLRRIQMGPLSLDDTLELGEYRELTDEEVNSLKDFHVHSKNE